KSLMNPEAQEAARGANASAEVKPTALNTLPDPDYPTGILSLTVYQCLNLDVPSPYEGKKSRTSSIINSALSSPLAPKGLIKRMTLPSSSSSSDKSKPRTSSDSKSVKSMQTATTHGTDGAAVTEDDAYEPPVGALEDSYLPSAYCTADVNDG